MALIKDYQGTEYDWDTIQKLAQQLSGRVDANSLSGGVFGTSGGSVGFDFDETKKFLGRDPTVNEQVLLDMARWMARNGITDISQLTPTTNPIAKPWSDADLGIPEDVYRFGETFTGKGGTSYWLKFDEAGNPIISTTGFSTSDKDKIAKALAVGGLLFGGASLLGGLGGGTAAGAGAAGAGAAGAAGAELAGSALFNAAVDSQLANLALGGDALAGYLAAGATPAAVSIGGTLFGAGSPISSVFNPAMDSQLANEAIAAAGGDPLAGYLAPGATPTSVNLGDITSSGLSNSITDFLKNPKNIQSLLNLLGAGAGAVGMGGGGGGGGVGSIPTQGIPEMSPEYFNAIQNYYNTYLPNTNPNVGSYLADWYGGKF